jgi:hypothetical protein
MRRPSLLQRLLKIILGERFPTTAGKHGNDNGITHLQASGDEPDLMLIMTAAENPGIKAHTH